MTEQFAAAVRFTCQADIRLSPEEIAAEILKLEHWPEFGGCFPLPGIQEARFEVRTPAIVGTRIRVANTDGSAHTEEVTHWSPETRLELKLHEFSPPLSKLATHFVETWEFAAGQNATQVSRTFELFARGFLSRAPLWGISFLLKRAVNKHLRYMAHDADLATMESQGKAS